MPEYASIKDLKFVSCSGCNGTGQKKSGLSCGNCQGMGQGVFVGEKFYFWGHAFGRAVIALSRSKRHIDAIINFVAMLLGLIGLISLGAWLSYYGVGFPIPPVLSFWRMKHWTLFLFWFSLVVDMFLIYRVAEDVRLKQRIEKLPRVVSNKQIENPDNWHTLRKLKSKHKIDVYGGYSLYTIKLIENAYMLAIRLKAEEVTVMHLFFCLLADPEVRAMLSRLAINEEALVERIKNQLVSRDKKDRHTELSNDVKRILVAGFLIARDNGQIRAKSINLIAASVEQDEVLAEIFLDLGINLEEIINASVWFRINERLVEGYKEYRRLARFKPSSTMDRAYVAVATPLLNNFAYDLTLAAKWFRLEFCVGRDKEIANVLAEIESGHTGVILIGEPGVGKQSVVHGIAELMVKEMVPKQLQDKRLLELDISRLVSGGTAVEVQERLLNMLDEIQRAKNIVLYINNLETIAGISAGTESSADLADVLVQFLERQGVVCLATVTKTNFLKYIERSPLDNAMAKIEIEEPVGNQAIIMAESKIGYLESAHGVYFTYHAIEAAVKLSGRYLHDKCLPEKAIKLLESIATKRSKHRDGQLITEAIVEEEISELTGIPLTKVGESEGKELLNLEEKIHERMIGQSEAVDMVAASLRRARVQLAEGKRPVASFLFMGPTGVGKTELAKAVSEVYFGGEHYMVRLDMSEYQTQDSIHKMIGDGQTKGYLTEAVRQAPFSLLLLDEFEKAHPNILNLFLQVMDDGRLTDGEGRTIDFTNTIIIATSNAGALYIQEQVKLGTPIEKIKEILINDQLNKIMRPELINRFDGIIVFKPLGLDEVMRIARLMLNKVAKMLKEKSIEFRIEEEGLKWLALAGYDPQFGARPLRRVLQDKVENLIANKLLGGELARRDTVVLGPDGQVLVEKARAL